ncbi:diaminopimelate decarboxylase [Lactobacillus sp. ESL0791]|uniref:diaminopimelate decarboxylase n=1 Tax=Lactobacillus sp. ESL0791 TaxID=2983234 RepID=UPI0023F6B622|nr:diaminopimelate decarboxylase [Lactobacillus sp. ESL0791]MDF7638065.1 diaminopimelate decarboxylase [Lactobacillus sp. ESL0791]
MVKVNSQGHLTIGGCDALTLAKEFGTPLYVYDVGQIRKQFRQLHRAFAQTGLKYAISYASKAFSVKAIDQVVAQEHGHLDVVSAGELMTAVAAGFPMKNISFHGNNKTPAELELALKQHVGTIIIDNFYELELLAQLLDNKNTRVNVMLRLAPGISAHTHEYIQTGQVDSKFGFDLASGQAEKALQLVLANPHLNLLGYHAHIGSQIMAVDGFTALVKKMVQLANTWYEKYGYQPQVLNFGGGFGIKYTAEDKPLEPAAFVSSMAKTLKDEIANTSLKLPAVWIEPGRSIVGEAGYSLYTIGARKEIPGVRTYLSVDGGMGDNIRPALYQAQYRAVLANNPLGKIHETVTIAGRYCESGDILIEKQELPVNAPGDILAVLATGAYGYSMASNYNRVGRPAVVFAEDGQAKLVVKRENSSDLTRLDLDYE